MPNSNLSDSVDDEEFFNEDEPGAVAEEGGSFINEEEAGAGSVAIRGDFKCDLSVEGEDVEVIRVPPAANANVLPVEPPKKKDLFRVPPSSTASVKALPVDPPQRKETMSRVPTTSLKRAKEVDAFADAVMEKRREVSQAPAAKIVPRLERVDYNDGGLLRLSPTPNTTSASVTDSTILAMSMLTMKPEDVPTFLLDCTTANFNGNPLVVVDKPCIYFGFRPIGVDSISALTVNSLADRSMYIKCRIHPRESPFKVMNRGDERQKLRAGSKHVIYVSFRPDQSIRCRSTLHISCYSGSEHRSTDSVDYRCRLLGFGGQAVVLPQMPENTKTKKGIKMSASGRYQLIPESIKNFSFHLENRGERDAFATVVLQDTNGEEIPMENAIVQPVNVLLQKKGQNAKKIEIRLLPTTSSRPSAASSTVGTAHNATGSPLPVVLRIIFLWGEERQRQRLKMLEKKKGEKFFLFNRYFTLAKYSGEQPAWDTAPMDELLSEEDHTLFHSCLRATTIEVLDSRGALRNRDRPTSTVLSAMRPISAGLTVVEIEPDNTFKVDDTLMGGGNTFEPL